VSLAKQHGAAIVFLKEKAERHGSLGSLVSPRAEALRECVMGPRSRRACRQGQAPRARLDAPRGGPAARRAELAAGPAGGDASQAGQSLLAATHGSAPRICSGVQLL